jgi:hypothetical protein
MKPMPKRRTLPGRLPCDAGFAKKRRVRGHPYAKLAIAIIAGLMGYGVIEYLRKKS